MDCSSWAGWTTSHGFDHSGARITRQDQIYNCLSCKSAITWPCTLVNSTKLILTCNTAFAREFSTVCLCSHSHSWSNSSANFRRYIYIFKKMSAGSLSLWKQDMQRSDQTQVQQLALKVQFVTTVWALKASTTPNTVLLSC